MRQRKALWLFAWVGLSQAAWAEPGASRCASERRWEDFSSIAIAVQGSDRGDRAPLSMKVEVDAYDDGSIVVADDDQKHLVVIRLHRPPGHLVLANVASAPLELGEISMLFELPMAVMREQFDGPCDLQARGRYPVDAGSGDDTVTGQFERDGDSVRFVLQQRRGRSRFSYSGSLSYKTARGKIPANLAIARWTVFHDSIRPEDGQPSAFDTLGELQDSLLRQR